MDPSAYTHDCSLYLILMEVSWPALCDKCVGCLTLAANHVTLKMHETEPTVF